jgi:hypothetical protein
MSRIGTILLAVALVSALVAVPLGVSAAAAEQIETNETDQVAPGERLAGVVGIQEAAVSGDLSDRRYEARLQRADTDAERAEIVADRRDEIDRRLGDHRTELAELRAAREAGNITEGTYRARVATLAAEKGSTERAAERASETARQLPADVLDTRGISVDELDRLRANASDLGGPETAAIAREIGGPNASRPVDGPRRGGPAAGNHTNGPATEDHAGSPASTPARTANGDAAADERRAAKSGDRSVGGSSQSTGSAADEGPKANDDRPNTTGDAEQSDTRDQNRESGTTDNEKSPSTDNDGPRSNNQ